MTERSGSPDSKVTHKTLWRNTQPGALLVMGPRAVYAATRQPIADAVIDVCHCDALSLYSGDEGRPALADAAGGAGPGAGGLTGAVQGSGEPRAG